MGSEGTPRTASEAARWLVDAEIGRSPDPARVVQGAEEMWQRLAADLSRWVGREAGLTLARRALLRAAPAHPVLASPDALEAEGGPLDAEAVQQAGAEAGLLALAAWLTALLELLGRFIGEEMAVRVLLGTRLELHDRARRGRES